MILSVTKLRPGEQTMTLTSVIFMEFCLEGKAGPPGPMRRSGQIVAPAEHPLGLGGREEAPAAAKIAADWNLGVEARRKLERRDLDDGVRRDDVEDFVAKKRSLERQQAGARGRVVERIGPQML